MLTVKAPIELKCKDNMIPSHEAFVQRIMGNYELMSASVTGEDLLHMVTEPPEVYVAEGSVSTLISQTNIHNSQEMKLEILNQLLNRISVDAGMQMTYQDRVYITDVLQKLGVRNVSQFMQQVAQLKEETENTTELINYYWNHMERLQTMVQDYRQNREEKTENREYRQEEHQLYLHRNIMNRLQTGSIYQIISNFTQHRPVQETYLNGDELRSFEYSRITRNILLNALENEVKGENVPLEYRHENYYEEAFPVSEEITEETITNRIAAAVLLQLTDNLYQSRHESISRHRDDWYRVTNAFYRSAENTINRLHKNFVEQHYRTEKAGDYLVRLNESYRQELTLLNHLFAIRKEAGEQLPAVSSETRVSLEQLRLYQEENQSSLMDNRSYREGDQYQLQQAGDTTEEKNYQQSFSAQEMYLHNEQTNFENTNLQLQQEQSDITLQQLEEFHRHNIENRNKYIQALEQLQQGKEKPQQNSSQNMQKMRQEALQALAHPQEMLSQLREENTQLQEQEAQRRKQELALLPEETQKIYEILEQYLQTPVRLRQPEVETNRNIGSLMRDIERIEHNTHEQELTNTRTDRQLRETIEATEQRWLGSYPVEGRPERRAEQISETEPIISAAEPMADRQTVEREIRQQELAYLQTDRQQRETISTTQQRWLEREPEESRIAAEGTAGTSEAGDGIVTAGSLTELRTTERSIEKQELFHSAEKEQLQKLSETVVERWEESSRRETVTPKLSEESTQNKVALVHKVRTENEVADEIMEQLINQGKAIDKHTKVIEEVTQNSRTVERHVTNQTTQEIHQQADNLTELIDRDVQGRIGEIADQVYSRLERRLQNERRRRGI